MSTTDPSGLQKLQTQAAHLVSICNTGEQMFAHSNPTTTVHFLHYDFWRRQLLTHQAHYLDKAQDTARSKDVCGLLTQERNTCCHLPSAWSWETDLEQWGWSCAILLPNHQELWPSVPRVEKTILFPEGTITATSNRYRGNKDNWIESITILPFYQTASGVNSQCSCGFAFQHFYHWEHIHHCINLRITLRTKIHCKWVAGAYPSEILMFSYREKQLFQWQTHRALLSWNPRVFLQPIA